MRSLVFIGLSGCEFLPHSTQNPDVRVLYMPAGFRIEAPLHPKR